MIGYQKQFGGLFRVARKNAGLTQAELATRADVGLSAVQAIEQGRGRVSTMVPILSALGLELRGRQLPAGPVGTALLLARKQRNISRRELANTLGVSPNSLVAVEDGGGLVKTLDAYAAAIGAGLYLAHPDAARPFATHAGNSSGNNSWQTPATLADALSQAVGGFDLDPCAATRDRRKARVKAKLLLTEADDGLSVPWRGKVFVNPPYGRGISQWIRKCRDEAQRGCVVVGLIPARPDTHYWHDFIAGHADVFMLRGRLKFGKGENSAPFASCVVVWNGDGEIISRLSSVLTGAWHVPRRTPVGHTRDKQAVLETA